MFSLFTRDLKLSIQASGGSFISILFFINAVVVVSLAIGPNINLLTAIGPAIIWISMLLACLLVLDKLFQIEYEDGCLDLMLMRPSPLALTIAVKCTAHWVTTGLPLTLLSPIASMYMNMDEIAMGAVMLTLLVGSPAIMFIGSIGAAVGVVLPRSGLLISILVLPLSLPTLIFGVLTSYTAIRDPFHCLPPFLILCSLTIFFAVVGPFFSALALRAGVT